MTQATTPAEGVGITSFIEDFQALMNRYKSTIACGNETVDRTMADIFEGSYRSVINHMVECEVLNNSTVVDSVSNGSTGYALENCSFNIKLVTLEWAFISNVAKMDVVKVENDIVSTPRVATALVNLNSMAGEVDMVDYVKARVEFILAIYETGKAKVDELNAEITTQLETA